MTVAEYIDYLNYSMIILDIEKNFDESLEYFDPVTWTSLHDSNVEGDNVRNLNSFSVEFLDQPASQFVYGNL